jgi:dTDP-4-dehydrorhamnose reductase
MRILILGVSGMLGNTMMRSLSEDEEDEVYGTVRSAIPPRQFSSGVSSRILGGIDVENLDTLHRAFSKAKPDLVVNCVGLIKQLPQAEDPGLAIAINSLLPHRLARICEVSSTRLVHFSTDCVFSGRKGMYTERDETDAQDLYGRSKFLGEVDYPHAITLRTSIIGHELDTAHGLVGWFLAQQGSVKGYTQAIFSGLPTCEVALIVRNIIKKYPYIRGTYHVAAEPITKYELLKLLNNEYGRNIRIDPDDKVQINRSLDGTRFREATGYVAPAWPELVARMRAFR